MRFIAGALLALTAYSTVAAELTGRVTGIADGDTLNVFIECAKFEMPIRLAGIDAPEKGMAFGNVSKRSLSEMAFGKVVIIEWDKKDKYGRLVGKVSVDGLDVNLEQVKKGLAWHFKEYQDEQTQADRDSYAKAENDARAAKAGLWTDHDPIAPWAWRKMKSESDAANIQAKAE